MIDVPPTPGARPGAFFVQPPNDMAVDP